jgi:hypothetical protein
MLYVEDYPPVSVAYYPEPYDHYYYPQARFWAGYVTGRIWGGIVDWDDGFWGGNWFDGDNDIDIDIDIDINCKRCVDGNDFIGKVPLNKVDWRKVDRSKVSFDKDKFAKLDKSQLKRNIKAKDDNRLKNKIAANKSSRPAALPSGKRPVKDVRTSTLDGLKAKPASKAPRPADKVAKPISKVPQPVKKPVKPSVATKNNRAESVTTDKVKRPVGKPRPAARPDVRPPNLSPIGELRRGKETKLQSKRGKDSVTKMVKRPAQPKAGLGKVAKPKFAKKKPIQVKLPNKKKRLPKK